MKFPFVKQADMNDCGPACLSMVCKFFRRNVSMQFLREKTEIGKEGVNLLGLSEAAESIGLETHCTKIPLSVLVTDVPLPAILHWKQEHFVVLYQVTKGQFTIGDPAKGIIRYNKSEFKKCWVSDKSDGEEEGVALLLDTTPAFFEDLSTTEDQKSSVLNFARIFQYLVPFKKMLLQLAFGLIIATILQSILPFLTQSIVDVGVNNNNLHFITIVLLAQLFLVAGRLVIEFIRGWILLHVSTKINITILRDFLIKLMHLPLVFFDSKKTGDILQRMNDHFRIESFLTGSSINILFSLLNLVTFSVVLAVFNYHIFGVFVLGSILYSLWVIIFLKKRRMLDYKKFDVSAEEQSLRIQIVQSMPSIKLHGIENSMRRKWEVIQSKLFGLSMRSLGLNQWQQTGALFITETKNIIITFISAKAVIDGNISLGTMLAIQYIVGQLNSPIEQMINFLQSFQNAKISMERLNEVHGIEDEEPKYRTLFTKLPASFSIQLTGGKGASFPVLPISEFSFGLSNQSTPGYLENKHEITEPAIHIRNLSFTYAGAGNEPVLHNLDFSIPKGKTTAIVGMSGSGKTTLLKLLLKFYDPSKGDITIDDLSLGKISHKFWRSRCGVVLQDSYLFTTTIAKNIALGDDTVDYEKLDHAVGIANARDFIEQLPMSYNTKIGADGHGLSMGQRQRILIARAVYANPQFLFFDEATNSLDANNEKMILNNLQSFFDKRTVIVVAHRLSTVKNADQIVVLKNGRIIEKGNHNELVQLKGEYFTLVKNQLELGD